MLTSGIWVHSSLAFPGDLEFMCVHSEARRIISSVVLGVDPVRHSYIAAWFRDAGPGQVEVRLRPGEDWRPQNYRIDGHTIYWFRDGIGYPWTRFDATQLPDWWWPLVQRANTRMDALEAQDSGNTGQNQRTA
jgi:hypothetical protein